MQIASMPWKCQNKMTNRLVLFSRQKGFAKNSDAKKRSCSFAAGALYQTI